jgi:ArsR family transcriptional regulator
VVGRHEISEDGKALRFYAVADFDEHLTPARVTKATKTLSPDGEPTGKVRTR